MWRFPQKDGSLSECRSLSFFISDERERLCQHAIGAANRGEHDGRPLQIHSCWWERSACRENMLAPPK